MKEKELYPVRWKNKLWHEKDCHEDFVIAYQDPYSLRKDKSVYLYEGKYVYPNGDESYE